VSTGADGTSSGYYHPEGYPTLFAESGATAVNSFSFAASGAGVHQVLLVQGIDVCAYGAQPVHCFANLVSPLGYTFWWDSQSTGEGLGVRWNWRGAIPVRYFQSLTFSATADANISWGGVMWGQTAPRGY
jgi:hypothetical protein